MGESFLGHGQTLTSQGGPETPELVSSTLSRGWDQSPPEAPSHLSYPVSLGYIRLLFYPAPAAFIAILSTLGFLSPFT